MEKKDLVQKAEHELSNGRVPEAMELLLDAATSLPEVRRRILHLQSAYESIHQDFYGGTITEEKFILERNKIREGLIDCAGKLSNPAIRKRNLFLLLALGTLIVVGGIVIFRILPACEQKPVDNLIQIATFREDDENTFDSYLWQNLSEKINAADLSNVLEASRIEQLIDPSTTDWRSKVEQIEQVYCNFSGMFVFGWIKVEIGEISAYLYPSNLIRTKTIQSPDLRTLTPVELEIPELYRVNFNNQARDKCANLLADQIIHILMGYETVQKKAPGSDEIQQRLSALEADTVIEGVHSLMAVLRAMNNDIPGAIKLMEKAERKAVDPQERRIHLKNLRVLRGLNSEQSFIDRRIIEQDDTAAETEQILIDPNTFSKEKKLEPEIDKNKRTIPDTDQKIQSSSDAAGKLNSTPADENSNLKTDALPVADEKASLHIFEGAGMPNATELQTMEASALSNLNAIIAQGAKLEEKAILNFQYLNLSRLNSQLAALPKSEKEKIHVVKLSNCRLTSIPNWVFTLPNLTNLELSNNQLQSFSASIKNLPKLERLVVQCNADLQRFPWQAIASFRRLKQLELAGTSLQLTADEKQAIVSLLKNSPNLKITFDKKLENQIWDELKDALGRKDAKNKAEFIYSNLRNCN